MARPLTRARPITAAKARVFLDGLRKGMTVLDARNYAQIPHTTIYDQRRKNPGFAKQWEEAYTDGTDMLEAEAQRRAVEGVERPSTVAGERELVREYSDTLLIFLLKGRRPDKYARFERPVGSPDNPFTVKVANDPVSLAGVASVLAQAGVLQAANGAHPQDD